MPAHRLQCQQQGSRAAVWYYLQQMQLFKAWLAVCCCGIECVCWLLTCLAAIWKRAMLMFGQSSVLKCTAAHMTGVQEIGCKGCLQA